MMPTDLRIAIISRPDLPFGLLANTVAAISIGIGAKLPILGNLKLSDTEGRTIDISSNRPVPILQADQDVLSELLLKALKSNEAAIVPFPAFARSLHSYADYAETFPGKDLSSEPLDGLGLAGSEKWVRSLTGNLKLLR